MSAGQTDEQPRVRLDKWLWAARFFKSRSLAKTAIDGGKVHLNDARVKAAKEVGVGDTLTITRGDACADGGGHRRCRTARQRHRRRNALRRDDGVDRRSRVDPRPATDGTRGPDHAQTPAEQA